MINFLASEILIESFVLMHGSEKQMARRATAKLTTHAPSKFSPLFAADLHLG
jgi:hypothetical protein